MKAILMSIRPKHVKDILNGDKLLELRKKFPADYRGWIYIYCTKGTGTSNWAKRDILCSDIMLGRKTGHYQLWTKGIDDGIHEILNGKVVARFYCSNVTEYVNGGRWNKNEFGGYDDFLKDKVCEKACITEERLWAYSPDLAFSTINIIQLKIFDTPKELGDFKRYCVNKECTGVGCDYCELNYLTKAPQSWCYIEAEDE